MQNDEAANRLALVGRRVRLEVDLSKGRALRLESDGDRRNWLWENPTPSTTASWPNWGGDKVWPASQGTWLDVYGGRWPPDPVVDGQPWRTEAAGERSLTLRSRVSGALGVRVTRRVEVDEAGAWLRWLNRIEQVCPGDHPVQVWTVTQVPCPQSVWLGRAGDDWTVVSEREGVAPKPEEETALTAWRVDASHPGRWKVGSMGRWLAAAWGDRVMVQTLADDADEEADYPERSRIQFFGSSEYAEIETLSSARRLPVGGGLETRVVWSLLSRNPGEPVVDLLRRWQSDRAAGTPG